MKVSAHAAHKWRSISRLLRLAGEVGCVATFLSLAFLIIYFSWARPAVPDLGRGWTVGISWTHPTRYGTAHDEAWVQRFFFWFFPSFGLIVLSEALKAYVLDDYSGFAPRKRPPWNHPWGP